MTAVTTGATLAEAYRYATGAAGRGDTARYLQWKAVARKLRQQLAS